MNKLCVVCEENEGYQTIANGDMLCQPCYRACGYDKVSIYLPDITAAQAKENFKNPLQTNGILSIVSSNKAAPITSEASVSTKTVCCVCGKEIGLLNRYKLADGWLCPSCFNSCGYKPSLSIKTKTKDDIQKDLDISNKNRENLSSFTVTKKIGTYIEFDNTKKQWLIPDGFWGGKKNPTIYNFSDIMEFELLEDSNSVTKGGLGRAVTGGLLLGGVGAIVGGATGKKKSKTIVNSLIIKITVNNINSPVVYINLISSPKKSSSIMYDAAYKSAHEILSVLSIITSDNKETAQPLKNNNSDADVIRKYKQLLDDGIITQEEFDTKKKQLLGL